MKQDRWRQELRGYARLSISVRIRSLYNNPDPDYSYKQHFADLNMIARNNDKGECHVAKGGLEEPIEHRPTIDIRYNLTKAT